MLGCGGPAGGPAGGPVPKRVISLAPALTETIYALGAEDLLVGVTPYCKFPPAAQSKEKVGALVDVSYEKLRSLDPDLVVLLPGQAEDARKLAKLGIRTMTFRTETTADIYALAENMGEALGRRERAAALVGEMKSGVGRLEESARARMAGGAPRPRVLFVVGRDPGTLKQIYACGSGNYLDELIRAVGAENVLGQSAVPWPVVSKEAILKLDPDAILDGSLYEGQGPDSESSMKAWAQMDMLSAAKNGRVVAIRDEHLMIPGPGFVECAARLAKAIFGPEPRAGNP